MSANKKPDTEGREQALRAEYGNLFAQVREILYRYDPIGIAIDNPHRDEYDPEISSILPRLKEAHSAEDLRRIVHEEFVRWFDPGTAGPEESYDLIAHETWAAWTQSGLRGQGLS